MVSATTELVPISNDPNAKFLGQSCQRCATGTYKETSDFSSWWVQCNDCDSFLFCYTPMQHQHRFHEDHHKVRMWSGGRNFRSLQNKNKSQIVGELLKLNLLT